MRRVMLPLVMLALTGTLLAQTPQSTPLNMSWATEERDGDKVRVKSAKIEFENGVTVTADELTFDKAHPGIVQLSGNVQMILKKK